MEKEAEAGSGCNARGWKGTLSSHSAAGHVHSGSLWLPALPVLPCAPFPCPLFSPRLESFVTSGGAGLLAQKGHRTQGMRSQDPPGESLSVQPPPSESCFGVPEVPPRALTLYPHVAWASLFSVPCHLSAPDPTKAWRGLLSTMGDVLVFCLCLFAVRRPEVLRTRFPNAVCSVLRILW